MADKNEKIEQIGVAIPVDLNGAVEGVSIRHANQAVVQLHENEMIISFFMTSPPLFLGTPEQQIEQIKAIGTIRPECVGRISIAPQTFKSLIEIMQGKLEEYFATEGKK